jgi:hypothetical protein
VRAYFQLKRKTVFTQIKKKTFARMRGSYIDLYPNSFVTLYLSSIPK